MSIGDILIDALSNTILGMGTVFAVLIIIIFVIMAMSKVVMSMESAKKNKAAAEKAAAPAPAPAPVQEIVEEEEVDDLELVAVITAAIAASMGSESTDGFVVRSIKRAQKRNW